MGQTGISESLRRFYWHLLVLLAEQKTIMVQEHVSCPSTCVLEALCLHCMLHCTCTVHCNMAW